MTLWKKAVALLLAATMMVPLALAAPSAEGSFSDVEDHWAQAEIEKAVATGWVDGYPDGTFKPEKTITRAEFTKMILDAIHLTPGCETVEWMVDTAKRREGNYGTTSYEPRLNDMNDHWLTTQGWTEAALYSGMVVPSDYNGGNFRPEKPIARYEIALMVTRALGQVYEAKQEEGKDLPFTDNEEILDWMKGYVDMASEAGVVQGYPDNSFRPNKASTRAEAVVMVQRMLDEMEQGLDPDIHVVAQYHIRDPLSDEKDRIVQEKATDAIQLQVVDDVVYASLLDLYQVRAEMMRDNNEPYDIYNDPDKQTPFWWPVEQRIGYENWLGQTDMWDRYQMGDTEYTMMGSPEDDFCAPVRALYGQAMIPIYDGNHPNSEAKLYWQSGWNAETQTLTIPVVNEHPYLVGS